MIIGDSSLFAYQLWLVAGALAGLHLEADATQHVRRRSTPADRYMQVLHPENRGHWRCTGSSAALNPSPRRLNPTTLTMTHAIASAMIQGDW